MPPRLSVLLSGLLIAACMVIGWSVRAQAPVAPTNDAPNLYSTMLDFFKMPAGRTWGSVSGVDVDRDGRSIWVAERCGGNNCLDPSTRQIRSVASVLKFDAAGKLVKAFGEGLIVQPHGITVDPDGNVWVTDGQDNGPPPAAGGRGRGGVNPDATKGHQVFKFSPDGKLLMTLGKPGGGSGTEYFYQPNDVLVVPNGDIFVCEGHNGGAPTRILKFDKTGRLIKTIGQLGKGPGDFDVAHSLAIDSKGRIYVADRYNNRIQIIDQDGKYIDEMKQFSRPSSIDIDRRSDTIYVSDSESGVNASIGRPEWKRGIRVGKIADGTITAFIPDPVENATRTSGAEGIAIDPAGNIYGAEVGSQSLRKYVRK
jgi:DNA-binding beta-propeller fold protein YncE